MTNILTTRQLAARIGISVRTVHDRAAQLGIKPAIDTGHVKLWRESDIERFGPPRPAGRPRIGLSPH